MLQVMFLSGLTRISDMEQETQAKTGRTPTPRGLIPSKIPSVILKLKLPRCRQGVVCPVGNILGAGAGFIPSPLTPPLLTFIIYPGD
jgi:hypothetical protein